MDFSQASIGFFIWKSFRNFYMFVDQPLSDAPLIIVYPIAAIYFIAFLARSIGVRYDRSCNRHHVSSYPATPCGFANPRHGNATALLVPAVYALWVDRRYFRTVTPTLYQRLHRHHPVFRRHAAHREHKPRGFEQSSLATSRYTIYKERVMALSDQESQHLTRPLSREQCYLCVMNLVDPPPAEGAHKSLRVEHKKFLAKLESEGRIFGAGKLENSAEGEKASLGFGMFILRAATRKEAENIAFEEPYTKAGIRHMTLVPWQRTEGDITIRISFTNGTMQIDRRDFVFGGA